MIGWTPRRQAYDEAVRGELRAEQQAALAAKQLGDDAQRGVGDAASLRKISKIIIGKICNFFLNFDKFLAGSFSVVSKRTFARKYAFDSIFQALQDVHTFATLQTQYFSKKSVSKSGLLKKGGGGCD